MGAFHGYPAPKCSRSADYRDGSPARLEQITGGGVRGDKLSLMAAPTPKPVSAELSLYPLTPDYEAPIKDFIHRLRAQPGIEVATNGLSTQMTGDYAAVMQALTLAMAPTLHGAVACSFVIKILNVRVEPGRVVEV